jgi:hypothetical protein
VEITDLKQDKDASHEKCYGFGTFLNENSSTDPTNCAKCKFVNVDGRWRRWRHRINRRLLCGRCNFWSLIPFSLVVRNNISCYERPGKVHGTYHHNAHWTSRKLTILSRSLLHQPLYTSEEFLSPNRNELQLVHSSAPTVAKCGI